MGQERCRTYVQSPSQLDKGEDTNVAFASLDPANVVAMKAGALRELLLAQPFGQPRRPHACTHCDEIRRFGHDLGCVRPIAPATHYPCDLGGRVGGRVLCL